MSGNATGRFLLDTNVVIYSTLDKLNLRDFLRVEDELYISSITYIEALGFAFENEKEETKATNLCEKLVRLFLTREVEKQTILIRKTKKMKLPDAIIAATAIVHDLTLVTCNTDDFRNIPELKILNPLNK